MKKKRRANQLPMCVVDTTVLQKANAPIGGPPNRRNIFRKRIALLEKLMRQELIALYSQKLMNEYLRQLPDPRNDYIRAFFEILTQPGRAIHNWHHPWKSDADDARRCHFPFEDDHVLRTAIHHAQPSVIYTEEARMLTAHRCVYRKFQVGISIA